MPLVGEAFFIPIAIGTNFRIRTFSLKFYLCVFSSETVNFFLPLALREANTLRPFALAILSRKPCLLVLFFLDGW